MIAGLIFAFTAATYVEATVLYPEAGGSSSFARHAFNELASFLAAWAQMLTYIVTAAISAFFVPHYLAVFWEPLGEGPADVFFGIGVLAMLAALNVKGTEESARLNLVLAMADLFTQAVLVIIGLTLVFNPDLLVAQVDLGTVPSWGDFALGIAVGMVAYTGIETISNMAEEARDSARTIPRGTGFTVIAVIGIYAFLPAIALSAMPVTEGANGQFTTELGTTYADDPVLGIVQNIGLSTGLTDVLEIYVGVLAAVILLIATNAALIGLSRLTFSMGVHRQFPELLRQVHPKFKTPYVAIIVFSGVAALVMAPGQTTFLGAIYAFGATLSFTVAHVSVIRLRKLARWPTDLQTATATHRGARSAISGLAACRSADQRGVGRTGDVRGVRRRDGARPGDPGRRWRLDDRRDAAVRRLPAPPGTAAARDPQGRGPDPARGRGGRVPERAGRLRRGRAVLRGGGGDREGARRTAPPGDPRDLAGHRSIGPAARRRAGAAGACRADQDRAGEADLRPAGQRPRRSTSARGRRARRSSTRRRRSRRRRS